MDNNGVVTGVGYGEATITVTTEDGGKTAECKVAVYLPSPTIVPLNEQSDSVWHDGILTTKELHQKEEGNVLFDVVLPEGIGTGEPKEIKDEEGNTVDIIKDGYWVELMFENEKGEGLPSSTHPVIEGADMVTFDIPIEQILQNWEESGKYKIITMIILYDNGKSITSSLFDDEVEIEYRVEAIDANFNPTGNVGIAPEEAGEAAGKIYAEYELVADGKVISLAEDNVEYIKLRDGDDWRELTANEDSTLWFNVENSAGEYEFEIKTNVGFVYQATLNWDEEIDEVQFEPMGREGIRPGTEDVYAEFEIKVDGSRLSLKEGDVKLIAQKVEGKWVELEPNTDETLWFNKENETGTYHFFIITKDGTMYEAELEWEKPETAVVETTGVGPSTENPVSGKVPFTFGFKSETGVFEKLQLDIYLGENTGEDRDYENHLGINIPAGVEEVKSWIESINDKVKNADRENLVQVYGEDYVLLLEAVGFVVGEDRADVVKENLFYEGTKQNGTWTLKLDTSILGVDKIEFLVQVVDKKGGQWGNNDFENYPDEVKAFLYHIIEPPKFNIISNTLEAIIEVTEE